MRVSFLAALDSVVIRALKYYKKKLIVYSKVVGLIELLLANCVSPFTLSCPVLSCPVID